MLNIKSGKVPRPQKIIVYGPEGIGKTTFAASFPDPVFIDTEGALTTWTSAGWTSPAVGLSC